MFFMKLIQFNENIRKYTIDLNLYVKNKCQKINFRIFVIIQYLIFAKILTKY